MADTKRRSDYFALLQPGATGVPNKTPASDDLAGAALNRAHGLRQFEIDNYWKRATYFWGFQLTAFAALALSSNNGAFKPPIVLLVATLGSVTAFAGLLTSIGSKMWQENWERHVDLLERQKEGELMEIVLTDRKLRFSVSRVNERLHLLLMVGWLTAFAAAAAVLIWPSLVDLPSRKAGSIQVIATTAFLVLSFLVLSLSTQSRLAGRLCGWKKEIKRK